MKTIKNISLIGLHVLLSIYAAEYAMNTEIVKSLLGDVLLDMVQSARSLSEFNLISYRFETIVSYIEKIWAVSFYIIGWSLFSSCYKSLWEGIDKYLDKVLLGEKKKENQKPRIRRKAVIAKKIEAHEIFIDPFSDSGTSTDFYPVRSAKAPEKEEDTEAELAVEKMIKVALAANYVYNKR